MKRRLRIVIADDEADIRQGVRRLLGKLGYEVVGEAGDGRELVELCRQTEPDLVITDVRMPEMSGIEAAIQINKTQTIPVIVVSSYERPGSDDLHCDDCDCIADFLLKPVSVPNLQAAIARACPAT
ncbi:putative transcriptional regulatory protein pdtaR [Novipirellula galeiformis]|uniref:Putative transcriptional regulatory protein pdtaR n=1 Tax=Novipirellula galeiformis TaxID=2528004 RepID=A0A5C6CEU8_9BACT|nr:response regulator [Novipirellula galeiformis]TWU23413.1 putative transcriptional regulatory protein pdtaR [Novipirellula galeiformis]